MSPSAARCSGRSGADGIFCENQGECAASTVLCYWNGAHTYPFGGGAKAGELICALIVSPKP